MYIQRIKSKSKDKEYTSVVLAKNYREDGKVKRKILTTLTDWPENRIEEFQKFLKGGRVVNIEDLPLKQGKSFGAIYVMNEIARQTGMVEALGGGREGKMALFQIYARLITQGSRLYAATQWAKNEAIEEILGLKDFDEDDLYKNLDWLADNQLKIEKELYKKLREETKIVYLYDVTSSYLEGTKNELAAYGYNRDKKKGKEQIVIGLLCNKEGEPVSVEVFEGNRSDMTTVSNQLKKLKEEFGVDKVAFVGDKGMLKSKQIEEIKDMEWYYITSITKEQIKSLLNRGSIQMELFEDEIMEVEIEAERYIMRRNEKRAREIHQNRVNKIDNIEAYINEQNKYLQEHTRAKVITAIKKIRHKINSLNMEGFIEIKADYEGRNIEMIIDKKAIEETKQLDGCYVIKTNISREDASKKEIHDRYKDLSEVEKAFRTMKTGLEEIRPIYVRKERRTRGHVFVCMLAYKIMFHIWKSFKEDNLFAQKYILECLDKINIVEYAFGDKTIKLLPKILTEDQQIILNRLNMKLPEKYVGNKFK